MWSLHLFKFDVCFEQLIPYIILNMHMWKKKLFFPKVPNSSYKSVISSHQQLKLKMKEKNIFVVFDCL
jgi:hypothetical protein